MPQREALTCPNLSLVSCVRRAFSALRPTIQKITRAFRRSCRLENPLAVYIHPFWKLRMAGHKPCALR